MSLDRDELLLPQSVLAYPVDGLELFGECPPPALVRRAAEQFAAFYRRSATRSGRPLGSGEPPRSARSGRRSRLSSFYTTLPRMSSTTVESYRQQVDAVVAVDNTEVPDGQFVARLERRGVTYVSLGENRGVAAALNEGCRQARDLGFDWVLTLDQDSTATPGMVARLFTCVELEQLAPRVREGVGGGANRRPRRRLSPLMRPIAMVAPVWELVGGTPVVTADGCTDLEIAMTSGCLTRLTAFEELGGFREDFFIDRVDNEYCLRAQRRGWRIVQRNDAVLLHRMGRLRRATFPVRCWVTDYTPERRYYMVRNLLEVRREYGREFPACMAGERRYWRKELAKIALAEPHRLTKAKMMILGWLDYRRGRFGKYEDLHPR